MRIAVFGATGAVGAQVVRRALEEGHEVVAHARRPERIKQRHRALRVVGGPLTDEDVVARAVTGADAVISALGPSPLQRGTPIADGTARIVAAMKDAGVDRLVAIATPSAPDPADRRDRRMAAIITVVRVLAPGPRRDVRRTAETVRTSGLRWTLARLPMLRDGTGPAPRFRTGHVGDGAGLLLTRSALAAYLVDAATSDRDVHDAPVVSDAD